MYTILENILKKQQAYQLENKLKVGELYNNSVGFVFTNEFGLHLDPNSPQRALKRVLKNCNIKDIHLHSLRHTFASLGFKNGIELKVMQVYRRCTKGKNRQKNNTSRNSQISGITWWEEKDSNLRTRMRTDLQSAAFSHSAICPNVE